MTGYESKKAMAQDKLAQDAFNDWWGSDYDDSTNPCIEGTPVYWAWAGWHAALAQPAQEPVAHCEAGPEYCSQCKLEDRSIVFGPQPGMHYGMNQDDWKDIVAAISKARDSRGIYLACRPADVFQDWFLALGTFKPKKPDA